MSRGEISDSDDDELFFQGGRQKPASIYNLTQEAAASSDEEENRAFETPAKRPRGRPRTVSTPVQLPRQEKKPKTSVFEISSDDEPQLVQNPVLDEHDKTVNTALAYAHAVLAQGDEDTLAREAEAEVERERAIREKEEEMKRIAAEEEKRRKEALAEKARKERETRAARASGVEQSVQDVDAIHFQVRMDDARKIRVRIRRSDPLMKMLPPFCKRFGLLVKDVVMRVDGEDVGERDTPETMDCDDGMQIDVAMRKR